MKVCKRTKMANASTVRAAASGLLAPCAIGSGDSSTWVHVCVVAAQSHKRSRWPPSMTRTWLSNSFGYLWSCFIVKPLKSLSKATSKCLPLACSKFGARLKAQLRSRRRYWTKQPRRYAGRERLSSFVSPAIAEASQGIATHVP